MKPTPEDIVIFSLCHESVVDERGLNAAKDALEQVQGFLESDFCDGWCYDGQAYEGMNRLRENVNSALSKIETSLLQRHPVTP